MKAIIVTNQDLHVVNDHPDPKVKDNWLLVRNAAVALNPGDYKTAAMPGRAQNCIAGYDFAGTVIEVGSGAESRWKVGDRLCGITPGFSTFRTDTGAFAATVLVKATNCIRLPDNISLDDAATLPLSVLTVGQSIFQKMGIALPDDTGAKPYEDQFFLVYGGSTAAGTLGIQFAKWAGYRVIATCSPNSNDLVKSRGVEAVFDYRDADCAKQIYQYTNGNLKLVWDTIAESEEQVGICMEAMSTAAGGKYGAIGFAPATRTDIVHTQSILLTALGEDTVIPGVLDFPASEEDANYMAKFALIVEKLLTEGKIKTHPAKVMSGGLDGVLDGLQLLKEKKVSGAKLVYQLN